MYSFTKNNIFLLMSFLGIFVLQSCHNTDIETSNEKRLRPQKDTIGFAQYDWQMDSLMARIDRKTWNKTLGESWKMAICPHDDYSYVGRIYPEVLQNIKAKNLILIGVAHSAAKMGIEDSLIFDTYTHWKGLWGDVPVSPIRSKLFNILKTDYAMLSDSLHKIEHSIESMIPFLQYFNRDISIVSILVPAMSPKRMQESGKALADAIQSVADKNNWEWGKDYAIVVTTDAVHYGNEDWGGKNMALYGCDKEGNDKAFKHELEIIENCLQADVGPEKIKLFSDYTLNPKNHREYKWTWCGRYSVPTALWTTYYLNHSNILKGEFIAYSTSITNEHIPVKDLGFGVTAIATDCHWVGYAALGYR